MGTNKATATLGGKPLLATSSVQWSLQEGTRPLIQTFDMVPADAISIASRPQQLDLVIDVGEGNPLKAKNLSALNIAPGTAPFGNRAW